MKSGFEIKLPKCEDFEKIYVAGAKLEGDKLLSNGGRVLGATAVSDTLEDAIEKAYNLANRIEFANGFYRSDIGAKALKAKEDI